MRKLTQKKFSISIEQRQFLENYRRWGYSDQSSIVRAALDSFMKELKAAERRSLMKRKAQELSAEYQENGRLTKFFIMAKKDEE